MDHAVSSPSAQRRLLRKLALSTWCLRLGWGGIVGSYAITSLVATPGFWLTEFGDTMQCVAALFAIGGLLHCTGRPSWRENAFWMLLALGSTLWLTNQFFWTYIEVVRRREVPTFFFGDAIVFLHMVPMIAALTLVPHAERGELKIRHGWLDFTLLVVWWLYLYVFVVLPWEYAAPDGNLYGQNYTELATIEELVFVIGLGVLTARARGSWRTIYRHLLCAAALYAGASVIVNVAIDRNMYYTGSFYDVPLVASFVWLGTAGLLARQTEPAALPARLQRGGLWRAGFSLAAMLSMPMLGLWSLWLSHAADPVREFRLGVTQVALIAVVVLVALRQRLVDRDRMRLLRASQESLEHLRRIQAQMVQQEKLASLGQLSAGAAHEINNPLTGILGYAQLLLEDEKLGSRHRDLVEKVSHQARRIKHLVGSLLRFARRVPAEKTPLDVGEVLRTALNLSHLDLRGKNIRIETHTAEELPAVRGDTNQLLQVFFNVIDNAVDALDEVGGGVLTIRSWVADARVIVGVADKGPGITNPKQVFDPFYTTKPVGKGTGLGLSICYGIVQEHGGSISCHNLPDGGAVFRIELPVASVALESGLAGVASSKSLLR